MTLREYTKSTLVQIIEGINDANEDLKESGAFIPATNLVDQSDSRSNLFGAYDDDKQIHLVTKIEFDVATTLSESDTVKGGVGVFVSVLNLGASSELEGKQLSANRVKFTLPLALPIKK